MLLKSIFTNSSGILVSRVLGFIRDLMTASVLGANIYSDIFFVAFKLPNLFRSIFADGAFTQAFIPSYAKSKHKIRFSSIIFLQLFGFLIILSLLVMTFSHLVAKAIAIGFDEKSLDLAAPLFAINFYYLPIIFVVTFMGALLQYKKHFATSAYSTALLNLAMIGSLLIAQNMEKYDITFYLSYGVLVGGFLQILVHLYAVKKLNLCKIFHFKKHEKKEESKFYKNFNEVAFVIITNKNVLIYTINSDFSIGNTQSYKSSNSKIQKETPYNLSIRNSTEKTNYIKAITNPYLGKNCLNEGHLLVDNAFGQKTAIYYNPVYFFAIKDDIHCHFQQIKTDNHNLCEPKISGKNLKISIENTKIQAKYIGKEKKRNHIDS